MISSTKTAYWATGITVEYREHAGSSNGVPHSGWSASLKFFDNGFCNDNADQRAVSTGGELRTRYCVADGKRTSGLSQAIDTLLVDAARLGIEFRSTFGTKPWIYYPGDGEWRDSPPPDNWKVQLAAEAARIGWETYA